MANILLLERRSSSRETIIAQVSARDGWHIFCANSVEEAVTLIQSGPLDLVLASIGTLGDDCTRLIDELSPLPVIVTSDSNNMEGLINVLEAGAVNFVPGHLLQERLMGAIESALSSALETSRRTRLLGWMEHSHSRFSIPTDMPTLVVAADRLQASLEMFGLCDDSQALHVRIALDEALANAFYHGNLNVSSELKETGGCDFEQFVQQRLQESPYCDRRIQIEEHLSREEARFVIRDEGAGFNVRQLLDPTDSDHLTRCSGRGILMMRHFLDDVRYNETGNEVTLVKYGTKPALSREARDAFDFEECLFEEPDHDAELSLEEMCELVSS